MDPRSDITLLVNPRAGHGRAVQIAAGLARNLANRGIVVDVPTVETVQAATVAVAEAVQRTARGLVVIGGDGLCHLAIQELAGTETALGIVAAGTGNDFAAGLGLPVELEAAATGIAAAMSPESELRSVDLGRTGERWWASVMCAGFDSAVNDRANRMRWPRGQRRYDFALLAELAHLRAVPMAIDLDGQTVDLEVTLVAVGNTSTYGGGIPICPDADPSDGLLDVTVVGPISRATLIRMTPTLRRGQHSAHPAVSTYRARSISLHSDADPIVTAYADGEPIQALPVTATCQPSALRILQADPAD